MAKLPSKDSSRTQFSTHIFFRSIQAVLLTKSKIFNGTRKKVLTDLKNLFYSIFQRISNQGGIGIKADQRRKTGVLLTIKQRLDVPDEILLPARNFPSGLSKPINITYFRLIPRSETLCQNIKNHRAAGLKCPTA